jgi:hypothetical protein
VPQIGHGSALFDDTPVNGEIEKGITSNWAYDEDLTLRALIEATLPWTIFIDPFPTPKSNTNWNTISLNSSQIKNGFKAASDVINNEITWDIVLAKGTWTIELLTPTHTNAGIISVQFDSVEKGTIDLYSESTIYNLRSAINGINVPTTKKIELKLKVTGQNTNSSGYVANLTDIILKRTA